MWAEWSQEANSPLPARERARERGVGNLAASRIVGLRHAHVAQAVEHFLGKEKVPGSNPGVGSNYALTHQRRRPKH